MDHLEVRGPLSSAPKSLVKQLSTSLELRQLGFF